MKTLFLLQFIFYIFGALIPALSGKNTRLASAASHLAAGIGSMLGLACALFVFASGIPFEWVFPGEGVFGNLTLRLDRLSAVFLFILSALSAAVSIYAVGYLKDHHRDARFLGFVYNSFICSMALVITAANAFYFLLSWEVMALTSYMFVVMEHEQKESRRAGLLYFVMTHLGTAFLMIAFLALFLNAGSFEFRDFQASASALAPAWKNAVFVCALIGLGTKAGMIPLHIWLPEAHTQAPSHASALMSGVMIKTAIYALLRFLFQFLGEIEAWWGGVILCAGILSALIGILYALMEHDLKRLLAYSSIENMGIVFLGIGSSLFFAASGRTAWAGFALIAALFHSVNHAFFKGLLFLGAGSVFSAVHCRDMERLGGLIHRMPATAAFFLTGCVAISALPPLNGFVSEWMTLIALFAGMQFQGLAARFFFPILASLFGFAGALAAMCFVKAFGITFLGSPRSSEAAQARESDGWMKAAMAVLSAGCVLLSAGAGWTAGILSRVAADLLEGAPADFLPSGQSVCVSGPAEMGRFMPAAGLGLLAVLPISLWIWRRLRLKQLKVRTGPNWDCGFSRITDRMQYSATGYSKPLRRIFSFLYQPLRRVEVEDEGHVLLRTAQRFESRIRPLFEEVLYRPLARWIIGLSEKARQIQTGHIQLYLSYILLTTIILVLVVRLL
ncbi:MAG: hydrogenase 4 subunit B [Candidatus Omnitrophica bacterium]|nr:hydrogenase 4 subunit B [Candidatus Omnitrophota bacterium]